MSSQYMPIGGLDDLLERRRTDQIKLKFLAIEIEIAKSQPEQSHAFLNSSYCKG